MGGTCWSLAAARGLERDQHVASGETTVRQPAARRSIIRGTPRLRWRPRCRPTNASSPTRPLISGRLEVYVRPFPEGDGQVASVGRTAARRRHGGPTDPSCSSARTRRSWRRRSRRPARSSAGAPEPLFEHPTLRASPAPAARYAVSRDGQRFLTVETEREREAPIVRVVENWLSEFSRAGQKN